ncbi:Exocyst complex component S5 [Hypoxylon texense]
MPSVDIKQIVDTKPLTFTLKTAGGHWKCQLHSDRASYERSQIVKAPGISRTDSSLSTSTTSSTSSSRSTSSH